MRWGHSLVFPFVLGLLPTADPGWPLHDELFFYDAPTQFSW